jgi:hypothetical protein
MSSSGKKKTTMAKLARENKLRERRQTKQAKKDARRSSDGEMPPAGTASDSDEAAAAFRQLDPEPVDPRAKEVALARLRGAHDDELAVFGSELREEAIAAGASEQEMRDAQREHPGHEG